MATIKYIERRKNWAKRPDDGTIIDNRAWCVKEGQEYDLVQFEINELGKPYLWQVALCVPVRWSDKKVGKVVRRFAKLMITEKDIKWYKMFLEEGETWGWD